MAHLRDILVRSAALRRLSPKLFQQVARIYEDPLRNRAFAFLDAILGPRRALQAINRLAKLRVTLVGCGGIGSAIAYLLAGMGVRSFSFIDPDKVEEGNLSRQILYTLSDVGVYKVDALAKALRERFRNTQIEVVRAGGLSEHAKSFLATADSVICAGDDPPNLAHRLREFVPNQVEIWACGYALGVSVIRPPSQVKRRASSDVEWHALPNGFAPSIGFQNLEIAARCCAMLTIASTAKSKQHLATHVLDFRELRT